MSWNNIIPAWILFPYHERGDCKLVKLRIACPYCNYLASESLWPDVATYRKFDGNLESYIKSAEGTQNEQA